MSETSMIERVAKARDEIAALVPDDAKRADDTDNQAGFRNAIEHVLQILDAALALPNQDTTK